VLETNTLNGLRLAGVSAGWAFCVGFIVNLTLLPLSKRATSGLRKLFSSRDLLGRFFSELSLA
jgi:hypothetical protein